VLTVTGQPLFAVQKQVRAGIVGFRRYPFATYNDIIHVNTIIAVW